jgi:hypothetical protein
MNKVKKGSVTNFKKEHKKKLLNRKLRRIAQTQNRK